MTFQNEDNVMQGWEAVCSDCQIVVTVAEVRISVIVAMPSSLMI
jgi:hypothetical protein